ncbi:MAG: hypothetical protein ACRCZJ_02930 [Erysipelotrichaceae bacterium]
MEQTIKQMLEQSAYQVDEAIKAQAEANIAAEQNELHDIDTQNYVLTLYALGHKYSGEEEWKAKRYCAMRIQQIFTSFPGVEVEFNEEVLSWVVENRAFLQTKYATMDKTLRKTSFVNIAVLTGISFLFLQVNLLFSFGLAALASIVMYKVMGKRMNRKLDVKLMEHYRTQLTEQEIDFVDQKVYL